MQLSCHLMAIPSLQAHLHTRMLNSDGKQTLEKAHLFSITLVQMPALKGNEVICVPKKEKTYRSTGRLYHGSLLWVLGNPCFTVTHKLDTRLQICERYYVYNARGL